MSYTYSCKHYNIFDICPKSVFAKSITVERQYNEVHAKGLSKFARYNEVSLYRIEVLFYIFYYYWGKQNRSLYRGLRYIESKHVRAAKP